MSRARAAVRAFAADVTAGARATGMLLALRARMTRSPLARAALAAGGTLLALILLVTINLGFVTKLTAATVGHPAATFAQVWAESLATGSGWTVASLALAGALLVTVMSPLTGTSTLALAPVEDLEGLRPNRTHRYFDSLLLNSVSALGLLQLVMATGVASLASMDGQRGPAILLGWSVWALTVVAMTTLGWALEWATRRFRRFDRRVLVGALLTGCAGAWAWFPTQVETLFGLAPAYFAGLRAGVGGWTPLAAALPALVLAGAAGLAVVGLLAARAAGLLPVKAAPAKARPVKARVLPAGRRDAVRGLLVRAVLRTAEVRRPLIALVGFGALAAVLIDVDLDIAFGLIAAVTIALALAAGANIYGVLGSGLTWIASLPGAVRSLPRTLAAMQTVVSLLLVAALFGLSVAVGRAPLDLAVPVLPAAVLACFVAAALSAYTSVARPFRARLSGQGDAVLPPAVTLGYMLLLGVVVLVPAYLVTALAGTLASAGIAAAMLALGVVLLARADRLWADTGHRARVLALVGAA